METMSGNALRLLRRRWYVVVAALILGALGARIMSRAETVSTQTLHVQSLEEIAGALNLSGLKDAPASVVALQAPEEFKRSADYAGLDAAFLWDDAGRSLTITVTGESAAVVRAGAARLSQEISGKITASISESLQLAVADTNKQISQLNDSVASAEQQAAGLGVDDPTRSVLLATAADLRADATRALNREGSLVALQSAVPTLVTSTAAKVESSPAAGPTTYLAGVLVAGALTALGACVWVLADHRIRRRAHIERAAGGVRVLGVLTPLGPSGQVDAGVVASLEAFVHESASASVVLVGVATDHNLTQSLAALLTSSSSLAIVASDRSAAGSVRREVPSTTAYVMVVRWGRATEAQLSSSVADLRSAGRPAVGALLIDVPPRERIWAGVSSQEQIHQTAEEG